MYVVSNAYPPHSAQLKSSMHGCICDTRGIQVSTGIHTHTHNLTRIINLKSSLVVRKKCCANIFISCERPVKVCDQNWIMRLAAFIELGAVFSSGVPKGNVVRRPCDEFTKN